MIRKIIPRDIQQALVVGIAVFIALLFLGGRFMYTKSAAMLFKYKIERRRVELENKVGKQLNELSKIRKDMSTIKESSLFLAEIAKLAGQLNLKLKSISATPIEKRQEFVKLGVNLSLDTTYHELGLFVSRLESADIFVDIDKLSVSSEYDRENPSTPKVIARMLVSTFSLTDTILEK